MPRAQLIYEEDCRLCRASARWIGRRAAGRLEPVPFDDPRVPAALQADRSRVHLVDDGCVLHGGAAITRALREGRLGWLGRVLDLPLVSVARDAGYVLIARLHHRQG